jgi:hypothetical protein
MNYRSVCLALLTLVFCLPAAVAAEMRFKHHFGDRNLSGSAWGQTALADLDGDGRPGLHHRPKRRGRHLV